MLNGISHTASRFFLPKSPQENTGVSGDTLYKMTMAYDGTGRRISKTRWVKARGDAGTLGVIGLFILSNDNWDEPETSPEQCSDK